MKPIHLIDGLRVRAAHFTTGVLRPNNCNASPLHTVQTITASEGCLRG